MMMGDIESKWLNKHGFWESNPNKYDEIPRNNNMKNVGLVIMRCQPFHNGHFNLISEMIKNMDTIIIGLGSSQFSKNDNRSQMNPYTTKERIHMINTVFGKSNKIKIIRLKDIGAKHKHEWIEYVLSEIEKLKLPKPNFYYAGSESDASWYVEYNKSVPVMDEGGYYLHDGESHKIERNPFKGINIISRCDSNCMSGTEIRKSIANDNNEWLIHTPKCIQDYIYEKFPNNFKLSFILETISKKDKPNEKI